MKIQPIDIDSQKLREAAVRNDSTKPVLKSRLKRLFVFDRQFPSVLRNSSSEKPIAGEAQSNKEAGGTGFEPSSVCLAKMVQNFIEETNEKQPPATKCGRNRYNCFNGNSNDSSDDEQDDVFGGFGELITSGSFVDAGDALKVNAAHILFWLREKIAKPLRSASAKISQFQFFWLFLSNQTKQNLSQLLGQRIIIKKNSLTA